MGWNYYVEDTDNGFDTDISIDDDEHQPEFHLNIHDWSVEYSDELWYLWDMIKLYIRDAFLEYVIFTECSFTDFTEFCYAHEQYDLIENTNYLYAQQLSYIWNKVQQYLDDAQLSHEILVGVTLDEFVAFVMMHSAQNNVVL